MIKKLPIRWRALACGLAATLACVASGRAESHRHRSKLSTKAREEARARRADKLEVMVRFRREPGTAERSLVRGFGGEIRRQHRSSRWMALRLPAHVVEKMADHPNVEFVTLDAPVWAAMDVAREAADAPTPSVPESGLTGAGVTIAVLDSGVAQHPEIQTLAAAVDFVANGQGAPVLPVHDPAVSPVNSIDPNGHGTHVAGIMVGNGSHSPARRFAGVAPEASLVSVRVLAEDGRGQTSDVLAGLQWVADHKDEYGIRVLNLSLGHPVFEPADDDPLVQAVDALWDAGVVVVCSAGNAGRSGNATISSPCNSRKVISVGALNDRNTTDLSDDVMATYSSRGPTRIDLVAKPDIIAPGNRIVSLRVPGSHLDHMFPERRVAADPAQPCVMEHFEMSGTSMSAPMVSGTAALMLEQDPSLNPGSVKARLMFSARKTPVGNPFASGAGALDILAALRTSGRVSDALSPRVFPDRASGMLGVENTALLWSDPLFSLDAVWSSAVVWSDGTHWDEPIIWSSAVLWSDSDLWPDGDLWPDAQLWPDASLWPDAQLWPDSTLSPDASLWSEAIMWPDDASPDDAPRKKSIRALRSLKKGHPSARRTARSRNR